MKKRLLAIGGQDGEGLKMFLGDLADVMLECRTELLPAEDGGGLKEMGADSLNRLIDKKRKRKEQADSEAASAKRARGPTADDEVIDLT